MREARGWLQEGPKKIGEVSPELDINEVEVVRLDSWSSGNDDSYSSLRSRRCRVLSRALWSSF